MKTLKTNNFTTIEQSKRLLKLGFPTDSADMYYQNALPEPKVIPVGRMYQEYTNRIIGLNREIWYFRPCWSVGRLIEIFHECSNYDTLSMTSISHETYIEQLIELYEGLIDNINFSKLEE